MDRARLKKIARIAAFILGGTLVLIVVAIGALMLWLRSPASSNTLFKMAANALEPKGIYLRAGHISGHLPFNVSLNNLSVSDDNGAWLEVPALELSLRPFKLLSGELWVESILLERPNLSRLPQLPPSVEPPAKSSGGGGDFSLPVDVRLKKISMQAGSLSPLLLAAMLPELESALSGQGPFSVNLDVSALLSHGGIFSGAKLQAGVKLRLAQPDGGGVNLDLLLGPAGGGDLAKWAAQVDDDGKLNEMRSFAGSELAAGSAQGKELVLLACSIFEPASGLLGAITGLDDFPALAVDLKSASNLEEIVIDFSFDSPQPARNIQAEPDQRGVADSGSATEPLTGDISNSLLGLHGALRLSPQNGVKGLLSLSPDWRIDLNARITPGPLLRKDEGTKAFYALLPPALLDILSPHIDIDLQAFTGKEGVRLETLAVNSELWMAGVEKLNLVFAEDIALKGKLLAEIKDQAFYEKLGIATNTDNGRQALWGQTKLEAQTQATLRGQEVDFTTDMALRTKSAHPYFMCTGLDADFYLQGSLRDSLLTLDNLRIKGLDMDWEGQGSFSLHDFTASLQTDFTLGKNGGWYQIISSLGNTTAIPCADFSGKLVAGMLLPDNAGEGKVSITQMLLHADIDMLADGFSWPADILYQGIGEHAKIRLDFSGPMLSPYYVNIYSAEVGKASFAGDSPPDYIAKVEGWYELALPGAALSAPLEEDARQVQYLAMQADLKGDVTDFSGFVPESLGIGGPADITASMFSVLGGNNSYFRFKAGADTPQGRILHTPVEDITDFSATADALMLLQKGVDIQGSVQAVAQAPKTGQIDVNSGWFVLVPPEKEISTGIRDLKLDSSAGKLGGHMKVLVERGEDAGAFPGIEGELVAEVDDLEKVNALLSRLNIPAEILYNELARLSMTFTPVHVRNGFRQDASLVLELPELGFVLLDNAEDALENDNAGEDASATHAAGADAQKVNSSQDLGLTSEHDGSKAGTQADTDATQRPDMELVKGVYSRVEVTDIFAEPVLYAYLTTEEGKFNLVTWNSFAMYVDFKDKSGRVNLAMRDDDKALEYVSGIEALAVDLIGREQARDTRMQIDLERLEREYPDPENDIEPEELFVVQAVFNLDPMEAVVWRLLAHSPSRKAGFYSRNPARIFYGDELRVEDVNLGMLTGGEAKIDAAFTGQEGRLKFNLKEVPISTARLFSNVPLPEGMIDADFNLLHSAGQMSGQGKLRALLRPMRSELDEGYDSTPVILTLDSVLDEQPGQDFPAIHKFGTQKGLAHLRGNMQVSATDTDTADLNMLFDFPLALNERGLPGMAYHAPLGARATWHGDVRNIWRLLPIPDRDLRGLAQFNFELGGSLAAIEYVGEAYMAGGRYEDKVVGLLLTDLALEGKTSPAGSLLRLSAKDGASGSAVLEATVDDRGILRTGLGRLKNKNGQAHGRGAVEEGLSTPIPKLKARGQVNHLAPLHRDDVFVRFSGLLDANGPLNDLDIKGDFIVERGEINILSTLGGNVSTLPVEVKGGVKEEDSRRSKTNLDIKVDIPNRLFIRGLGLESEWEGNIAVHGPIDAPFFEGKVSPVRGYMNLLSRPFALGQGNISFWGGDDELDSSIALQLTYSSPNLVANIHAGGSATRPTLVLSSVPPMPQDQILSEVLFGKNITQLSPVEALQVANAVRELVGFGSGGFDFMTSMRRFLGVDTLRIGSTGSSSQTRRVSSSPGADAFGVGSGGSVDENDTSPTVEAGKYLNDAIYIGVEQGAVEDSTRVRVEVELRPNLTLQGSSSTKSSDVGIGWKKDY